MTKLKYEMDAARAKWAMEIGRFVLAFGSIERITYMAMRQIPADPIADPLVKANMPLGVRLDLLRAIAKSKDGDIWVNFEDVLGQIKGLTNKRNIIAHNSLMFDIHMDDQLNFTVREVIQNGKVTLQESLKKPDIHRIEFAQLVKHREEVEALNEALLSAVAAILTEA